MSTPYLATNSKELFEAAPADIKTLIKGGEVSAAATVLGEKYKIPVGLYQRLSNLISYVIIGAILPTNVVVAILDCFQLTKEDATMLANDLETSIFAKARQITLGNPPVEEVTALEFQGEKTKEELRKELLDTTKRESGLMKAQTSGVPKKPALATPGSRSQLLEQLQILGNIPQDEEIEERLKKIQDQIGSLRKEEESNTLESNIALKSFMFGDRGKNTVEASLKTASYSVAPTRYNVDPYREIGEE